MNEAAMPYDYALSGPEPAPRVGIKAAAREHADTLILLANIALMIDGGLLVIAQIFLNLLAGVGLSITARLVTRFGKREYPLLARVTRGVWASGWLVTLLMIVFVTCCAQSGAQAFYLPLCR